MNLLSLFTRRKARLARDIDAALARRKADRLAGLVRVGGYIRRASQ